MTYKNLVPIAPRNGTFGRIAKPVGAVLGALVWEGRPILGLLTGYAVAKHASDIAEGETTLSQGIEGVGIHVLGAAASVALPGSPAIGYIGGRLAGKIILPKVIGEVEKQSSFFKRPVKMAGGMPVWQVAVVGGVLIGAGYGVHRWAGHRISEYAKTTWQHVKSW